jgi:hypothetical protein
MHAALYLFNWSSECKLALEQRVDVFRVLFLQFDFESCF